MHSLKNNNLYVICLIAALFRFHYAPAQTYANELKIQNGPLINEVPGDITSMIGQDETGYYYSLTYDRTGKHAKPEVQLKHLNNQLQSDVTHTISDDNPNFDFCAMLKENLYLFSTQRDKDFNFTISCRTLNKITLTEEGNQQPVSSGHDTRRNDISGPGFFHYAISEDQSHLLLYNLNYKPAKQDTETYLHVAIFDSAIRKLWEKEIVVAINPDNFRLDQVKIDNEGRVYIVTLVTRPNRYQFFRYANDPAENISVPLLISGKRVKDFQSAVKPDGNVVLAGFYTDSFPYDRSHGAFNILIDGKTHAILKQNFSAFEKSFTDDFIPELEHMQGGGGKKSNSYKPGLRNLRLKDLLMRADGSLAMIAEQYTVFDWGMGPIQTSPAHYYTYSYGFDWVQAYYYDIIIVDFDSNGNLNWKTRIPKRQFTESSSQYFSYSWTAYNGALYFFYNDNPVNYPPKPGEDPEEYRGGGDDGVVIMAKVDSTGKFSCRKTEVATDNKLAILPKKIIKTGQNKLLFISSELNDYEFSVIEIQ